MNMIRFLEYIVFFLLGYKLLKILFVDGKPKQRVQPQNPNQNINSNNNYQQTKTNAASNTNSKFNDAEFIDYEEVK